jgi:hypothetical protein
MKRPLRPRLVIPATLSLSILGACSPSPPTPAPDTCDVVPVPDASVPTYQCSDGRTCGLPDPSQEDGGIYQICPGPNECATLVVYDGGSTIGFC